MQERQINDELRGRPFVLRRKAKCARFNPVANVVPTGRLRPHHQYDNTHEADTSEGKSDEKNDRTSISSHSAVSEAELSL